MAANGRAAGPPPPSRPPRSAASGGSSGPTPKPHPTVARHWRQFTERYGWRAYALPVLVVLTVLALATTNSPSAVKERLIGGGTPSTTSATGGPAVAASNGQLKSDDPGAGALNSVLPALALPPGPAYTTTGRSTYATIPGKSKVIGKGTLHKFSIEVENGVTGVDLTSFANTVVTALSNPQSWISDGKTALQRVDTGPVDFHVTLVSSMTVRRLCGYDLPVETSCYDGADTRVVLNVARWVRGAKAYSSDLATYRLYAVNHEVGHALGHNHSHGCLANGFAPVMMQQTIGTRTASGKICQPNPWPYPTGVKDAPGPEEAGSGPDLEFYKGNSS
ncbi:MAG: hypothetical protein QOE89_2007 [Pseudonocardiales bacterium]|nr:hypothetical protein [Pseudonocardiales bacterium]